MLLAKTRNKLQYYRIILFLITLTSVSVFHFYELITVSEYYTIETDNTHKDLEKFRNDTLLIDLKNFQFLIDSRTSCDECKNRFLLIVLVHTAISNIGKRTAIRNTWGKQSECVKILYVMGLTKDKKAAQYIQEENEKFHDIIQGNFMDTYRNNTYKHVMVLKWAALYCRQAKYIVKTDDDIVVNVDLLYAKLEKNYWNSNNNNSNTSIICPVHGHSPVVRNNSKWAVTKEEYPGNATLYPKHCFGFFIIYPAYAIHRLLGESYKERYFWIDDVHVSGTLAEKAGLQHIDIWNWYLSKADDLLSKGPQSFIYGPMEQSPESIYKIWKSMKGV